MYFCIDEENRKIVDQNGVAFTVEQFNTIRERYERQGKPIDMTMSCRRLMSFNYDWDELAKFYNEN